MCSAAAPEATEREAKMNMTVSVKERIPKQRTERRAYVTERARESDSLLVRTDRPGLSMQYKLIAAPSYARFSFRHFLFRVKRKW